MEEAAAIAGLLNPEQTMIFEAIMMAAKDPTIKDRLFFVNGPGGTGKTYLFNAILKGAVASKFEANRALRYNAVAVAFTGIAAILLDGK